MRKLLILAMLLCAVGCYAQNQIDLQRQVKNVLPQPNGGTAFSSDDHSFSLILIQPTVADSGLWQHKLSRKANLKRVSCSSRSGTVTIQLEARTEIAPEIAGTNLLSAPLICLDSATAVTTSFAVTVPANAPIALIPISTTGNPDVLRVHVTFNSIP